MRRGLPLFLLLLTAGAGASSAQGVTMDAAYGALRNKVLVAAAYGAPSGWFLGVTVRVMYSPVVDVAGQTGLQGYTMSDAIDTELLLTAGLSLVPLPGISVSPSVYAGAWRFSSEESLAAPSRGIDSRDTRTLSAFRAGLRVDARWTIIPSLGLGLALGTDVPWQLFQFSALGLAEASALFDISAGVTWRVKTDP